MPPRRLRTQLVEEEEEGWGRGEKGGGPADGSRQKLDMLWRVGMLRSEEWRLLLLDGDGLRSGCS